MRVEPIAVVGAGAVCSVGLDTATAFAAIRAGVAGFAELDMADRAGDWIRGSRVPLSDPVSGTARHIRLLSLAVRECLADAEVPLRRVALILCGGDTTSPAHRVALVAAADAELAQQVSHRSAVYDTSVGGGRAAIVTALAGARQLLAQHAVDQVLVAAVDSLLSKRRLLTLEREGRLLTRLNQNGFLAGEAAAAVLVSRDEAEVTSNRLICAGLGTAGDESSVSNDVPLRGDGLCQAIRSALDEAGCALDHLDFRISDVSGEQYYFKEASLAVSRLLRQRREQFPLWHPADCIGEVGSAIGPFVLALARTAVHKGYAPGPDILCHFSSDGGLRGAIVLSGVAGK